MTAINNLALSRSSGLPTHSNIAASPAPQLHLAAPAVGVPATSQQAQATAAPIAAPPVPNSGIIIPNDGSAIVPNAQQPQMLFMAWQSPRCFHMQAPMCQHPSMAMAASQTQLPSGSGEDGAARQQPSQPPMPMFQHWPNAFPVPQQYGGWAGWPGPYQYYAPPPMQGHFMGQVLVHGQHGWAGSQVPQPLTNVVTGPEGTMPTSSGSGSAEDTTYHPPLSQPQQPQTSLATPGTGASLPLVALATPKHCTEAHCSAPEELSQPSTGCIKYTGLFQAACSQMTARRLGIFHSRLGIFRDTSLFINALIIMYEWSHVHECIDEQAHVTKKPKAAARAWNHPNKTLFALIITQKAERHTAFAFWNQLRISEVLDWVVGPDALIALGPDRMVILKTGIASEQRVR
ncbi:MAG: hypothetical protein FRX49_08087 [Trebouxia sp. A1-2]|nr:MAG: hypothetical protein FRX49_08087 [Trebouxia sp. A1-2]